MRAMAGWGFVRVAVVVIVSVAMRVALVMAQLPEAMVPAPSVWPGPSGVAVMGADSGRKSNLGAIVGGIIAGVLFAVLVMAGMLWYLLRRAKQQAQIARGEKSSLPTADPAAPPPTHAQAPYVPPRPTPHRTPDVEGWNAQGPTPQQPAPRAAPVMVNDNKKRLEVAPHDHHVAYNIMEVRRYSFQEVEAISSNWTYKLGEGGFGSVYYGEIFPDPGPGDSAIAAGPQPVALKRLSATSQQGKNEFLNEVRLLSRIHYRYLVSLVGFCDEINNQVLIYEYVQEGSLADWLHGASQGHPDFNWYYRLLLALHAALGLEYLHVGARPNIIHRDVKSSNILITKDWEGRVADFGLSKTGVLDQDQERTHMTTLVKGTPGYLDPEYFRTAKLTTKSDVYSFGIVLLELVTGRLPIDYSQQDPQLRCIENYVQSHYPHDLTTIADPNLKGNFSLRSMKTIVHVALRSVALQGANRPTMSDVVGEIRSAMKLMELGPDNPTTDHGIFDTQDSILSEAVAEISKTPTATRPPGRPRSGLSNHKHRRSPTELPSSSSNSTGSSSATNIPSNVALPLETIWAQKKAL